MQRKPLWVERHRPDYIDSARQNHFFYGLFFVSDFVGCRRFVSRVATCERDIDLMFFGQALTANQVVDQVDGRVFHSQSSCGVVYYFKGKERKRDEHGGENKSLDFSEQRPLTDCINRLPYVAILFWLLCQGVKFEVPVVPRLGALLVHIESISPFECRFLHKICLTST